MPSVWDHKSDKDLLLAIIDNNDLKSIPWPSIAAKMNAKGYSFTHEACRQHFQKLRRDGKKSTDDTPTTPADPKPRKRSANKAHGAHAAANEDDEEEPTPSKKRKRSVKKEEGQENEDEQTAYQFKMEQGGVIDLENDDMYES